MEYKYYHEYKKLLRQIIDIDCDKEVNFLITSLWRTWQEGGCVYLCGNGGSAANAIHIANDFIYGISGKSGSTGLRVEALCSNTAVITCLANDTGYDNIFAEQLRVKGRKNDVLIALSGSGNSPNIISAINSANSIGMITTAILGFDGGVCKTIAGNAIHFQINDMQASEDAQLIVGHTCMKALMDLIHSSSN